MKLVHRDGCESFEFEEGKAKIVFFTAKDNLNFSISKEEGLQNLLKVRDRFQLKDIGYSYQVHSDIVRVYHGRASEGDSLITDRKHTGLGVFTADCVPVMLYDSEGGAIAAVHSGWRGTFSDICGKTIKEMNREYGSKASDIHVYIGPHIRECCYEVSEELVCRFRDIYPGIRTEEGSRQLSLEKYIMHQCLDAGVDLKNINTLDVCTCCSCEYELHSYRKDKESSGRLLSLIYLEE